MTAKIKKKRTKKEQYLVSNNDSHSELVRQSEQHAEKAGEVHLSRRQLTPATKVSAVECHGAVYNQEGVPGLSHHVTGLGDIGRVTGSRPSVLKHVFEMTVDPKGPPIGSTFWSGLGVPDPLGLSATVAATPIFPTK